MGLELLKGSLKSKFPKKFLNNVAWQYLSSLGSLGFGFVYILVLGRYLGKAEFGLFSLALASCTLVFNVFELRLHETVMRYVTEYWEMKDEIGTIAVIQCSLILDFLTGVLAFCVLLLLAPYIQHYLLRDSRGIQLISLMAFSMLFGNIGSATATGILRIFDKYKWVSIIAVSGTFLKLISALVAIEIFKSNITDLLGISILCSVATNLGLVLLSWKCLRCELSSNVFNFDLRLVLLTLRKVRNFVTANYLTSVSGIAAKDLDLGILGWFTSSELVGTYKIAKTFSTLISQTTAPISFVLLPEFSKFYVNGLLKECKSLIKQLSVILFFISLVSLSLAYFFVPTGIRLFLGETYYQSSMEIFWCMVWWVIVVMPLVWTRSLSCAVDKPNLYLTSSIVGNVIATFLYLILIPRFAGAGAAFAFATGMSLTAIISAVLSWTFAFKHTKYNNAVS